MYNAQCAATSARTESSGIDGSNGCAPNGASSPCTSANVAENAGGGSGMASTYACALSTRATAPATDGAVFGKGGSHSNPPPSYPMAPAMLTEKPLGPPARVGAGKSAAIVPVRGAQDTNTSNAANSTRIRLNKVNGNKAGASSGASSSYVSTKLVPEVASAGVLVMAPTDTCAPSTGTIPGYGTEQSKQSEHLEHSVHSGKKSPAKVRGPVQ